MSKKLLFITTRLFWPTDSGRKVGLYNYCKGLHEMYDYEIYVYSFLEYGQDEVLLSEKPSFIKEIRIASGVDKISKFLNMLLKTVVTRDWPIQCSLFYSKKNEQNIHSFAHEIKPDVIIVDMVRLAPYYSSFFDIKCTKILDMDDLLSQRYERQMTSSFQSNIAGQYSSNLSRSLLNFIDLKLIKRAVLSIEKNLMAKAEVEFAKIYDSVIFVSSEESNKLNKILPDKAVAIPLGIATDQYRYCSYQGQKHRKLCFVGNMQVAANIDTLRMIVEEILPKIKNKCSLIVIGKCTENLKKQYAEHAEISFTGRVESIYEVTKKCDLFLAPIAYGSGIKTKILEAMAMQLPVVTNNIGAEGLDVENGKHLIIEDDYEKIAKKVDWLLNDYSEAKRISENGQQIVFEKYDWINIWKEFEKVLPD